MNDGPQAFPRGDLLHQLGLGWPTKNIYIYIYMYVYTVYVCMYVYIRQVWVHLRDSDAGCKHTWAWISSRRRLDLASPV